MQRETERPMKSVEIWAATPTPFDNRGELDLGVVPAQLRHLQATGVFGAFVAGTTGEFPSLTGEERQALVSEWAAQRPTSLRLGAHIGATQLGQAQQLAAQAESAGVDMVASVAPFYGKASLDRTVSWLADLAQAAPNTPFCFYHIPSMTGSSLRPSEVVSLAVSRIPTLRAVKFTDPDLLEFAVTRAVAPDVRVYFGRDELLPAALAFGADGVIGSLYNGLAPVARAVIRAFAAGRTTEAFDLHQPFRATSAAADAHGGVGFIKELMNELGPSAGVCRPPWGPIDAAGRAVVERLAPTLQAAVSASGPVEEPV
jgi:N-acetylneuraminate lyase